MTIVTTDDSGRITIPEDVRERFGDRYRLVQRRGGIVFLPVSDDHEEPVD